VVIAVPTHQDGKILNYVENSGLEIIQNDNSLDNQNLNQKIYSEYSMYSPRRSRSVQG
jgi:hypothetical protein